MRDFVEDALKIGLDKVKGSHAYRQNSLDPGEWWIMMLHVGTDLDSDYYMDIQSNFGVRLSGIFNQLVSESI